MILPENDGGNGGGGGGVGVSSREHMRIEECMREKKRKKRK